MFSTLLTAAFAAAAVNAEQFGTSPYNVPIGLGQIIMADNTSHSRYPTDLTRNIVPKNIHSHNDYWRDIPFYTALSVGAISVEADVWLKNGTLYVGHEESALTTARTFDALYIQPILSVLRAQNPNSSFVSKPPTKNGLWDTASTQTSYLWVDVKTDGATTFPAVVKALQPLRAAGYLTSVDSSGAVSQGPITVIGTGNTPLDQVQGVAPRDYFWDAPLPLLNGSYANITAAVSPIASTDFASAVGAFPNGTISPAGLAALHAQVATAKAKGIGARYWDTPGWPIYARNRVWEQLWEAGITLLNADDVVAAAGYADRGNWWSA